MKHRSMKQATNDTRRNGDRNGVGARKIQWIRVGSFNSDGVKTKGWAVCQVKSGDVYSILAIGKPCRTS